MTEPDRTLTRPPYVAGFVPGNAEPARLMPVPQVQPSPDLVLQHLVALRAQVDDTRTLARAGFLFAAGGFVLSLIAAVAASYTAYVVYTILNAIREAANGIH